MVKVTIANTIIKKCIYANNMMPKVQDLTKVSKSPFGGRHSTTEYFL